ncbi:SMP-30/gluconolactonase/LRE family protein [Microbacterium sp. No. 7]|uniref:SMP-30/gluconolactonase/LRE family protein n=1 Tax=Microbacterium sp. No. 7 TaxID=1714373 RepID=UPI0006D1E031|nr:SMP-30/gluconolactonase/LRE family protein [Microbacterium sp. No. 7]ALJ20682.1 hypothetical protein AOA12_12540 [Microbacterium sp. No. 7]
MQTREITGGRLLVSGLTWPECPRWTSAGLIFSDMHAGTVLGYADGEVRVLATLPPPGDDGSALAGGTGLTAEGDLLVVSMLERIVYRFRGASGDPELFADLRPLPGGTANDLILFDDGTGFVSQFGSDFFAREPATAAPLLAFDASGRVRSADELGGFDDANGMASDGTTFYVAESSGARITAVDLSVTGSRRTFVETPPVPDGMSWGSEGLWVAFPASRDVLCWDAEGRLVARVTLPAQAGSPSACAVGGEEGRTLYVCAGFHPLNPAKAREVRGGSVWAVEI